MAISAADAERIARQALVGIGALPGDWIVRSFESEVGYGYACAADVAAMEIEKRAAESAPATAPDRAVASSAPSKAPGTDPGFAPDCPPPPPPVKAWNVSFAALAG